MLTSIWLVKLLAALLWKPSLWAPSVRQIFILAKNRWPLVPPFLPFPSRDFLEFRLITYHGKAEELPDVEVVITWLTWVADLEKSKI
jgi:hypothetical protein